MSDRRYTAIFGAAVLTASVATFSVYRLLSAAAHPRQEPTRPVVVVTQDVPAGVTIPREAVSTVPWPTRIAPAEAMAVVDSVVGRVARTALVKGEPVRTAALAARGTAPGLEATIAPDRRAIAVRVNEAAGVSGIVRPDSRVDVLVTSRGDGGGTTARLVMADVRVLGVGPARPVEKKEGEPAKEAMSASVASIVTLEVTPAQAALVAAAEQQGTIQVVLRGFGHDANAADALAAATTFGGPSAPAAGVSHGGEPARSRGGSAGFDAGQAGVPRSVTHPRVVLPFTPPPPADLGGPRRPTTSAAATSGPASVVRTPPNDARRATAVGAVASTAGTPAATTTSSKAAPESVTVHVYRGGQLTQLRVEASTPAAAPPAPVHTAALRTP